MPPSSKDYSEATAQEIDRQASGLVEKAHHRAKEILEGKRDTLEQAGRGAPGKSR